ncbi:hypothetical protein E1264_34905 [Actinomadura sp. KC216]|uniref:hypothetical protein n=1 Tax=Actinomadura sp. KC216 TaxID=2530370 RepID=UPI001050A995|nr:hypothetical protein [Actinomadura sp. KC216]TDB79836.1 hypothetical protein E1264_34905 [Actinomadura sp. KC216]
MNALIAAIWFIFSGLCLVVACLAWLRALNLLTGRTAQGIPRWLGALAVVPLTLPGIAGLWFAVGTLAD